MNMKEVICQMKAILFRTRVRTSLGLKIGLVLIVLLVFLLTGCAAAYCRLTNLLEPVKGSGSAVHKVISIPQGSNSAKIGKVLEDQGLIRSRIAFRLYAKYKGLDNKLQAGQYNLHNGLSTPEIIKRIAKGEVSSFSFTIPEGYTIKQITDKLAEKKFINRARFLDLLAHGRFDYEFLKGLPEGPNRLEGYLFPDTYRITKKTTEEQIINMMLARFGRAITPDFGTTAAKNGLTIHQAVTLASIIEREVKKDEEREKAAAVFLNRLQKGWKLESCATVQYILGEPRARLLEQDLRIDSPYNTYLYAGLPPGPIASPGGPSLRAAVHPADVDYMFFVVAENGEHIFSRTLEEHNRNKAAYLEKLKNNPTRR